MTNEDDLPSLYFREIARVPRITPREEVVLAARIKRGDKEARETMIAANLRLVVKIARNFTGQGLSLADLVSEGNIGLVKAVERFDPGKGAKLSTYAAWWIKQMIRRALSNQAATIRLPAYLSGKIAKMTRVANRLTEELGREPSDEEVAIELGLPVAKVSHLRRSAARLIPLDAPRRDGEDGASGSMGDIIEDERARSPYEEASRRELQESLDGLCAVLDQRERRIIDWRFGTGGMPERTLDEIGREFGCTRENIRLIQKSALRKMRQRLAEREKCRPAPVAVS